MADQKKRGSAPAKAVTAVKKDDTKPGFFKRVGASFKTFFKGIGRFFLNMKHELKKVTWPTKKEMVNYSLVVFAFMIVMTILIGLFDFAAGALVDLIVKL